MHGADCTAATRQHEVPCADGSLKFRRHGSIATDVDEIQPARPLPALADRRQFSSAGAEASDARDVIEIHPLLQRTVAVTRPYWRDYAVVSVCFDDRVGCVRVDARDVIRACTHAVVDTARAVAERDGGMPSRRGHVLVATVLHGQRVDICVSTEGFRHVLQLTPAD